MATCPPNKLGITDPEELQRVEAALTSAAIAGILSGETPLPNTHGIERLQAIHRTLFKDLYDHAGVIRTGTLAKQYYDGSAERTVFTHPAALRGQLNAMFADLRSADAFKGLGRIDFADRATDFLARCNSEHPFSDGNGRTQRTYLQLLALDAGHHMPLRYITQERMVAVSIQAAQGDLEPMRDMLHEQLDTTRREALRGAYEWLDGNGYAELNQRILATTTPGKPYVGALVTTGGENFVMTDGKSIIVGNTVDLPAGAKKGDALNFVAGMTPAQALDAHFNQVERNGAAGKHVAAIEAGAKTAPERADSPIMRAGLAKRLAEAACRDEAYSARHHGITRPKPRAVSR